MPTDESARETYSLVHKRTFTEFAALSVVILLVRKIRDSMASSAEGCMHWWCHWTCRRRSGGLEGAAVKSDSIFIGPEGWGILASILFWSATGKAFSATWEQEVAGIEEGVGHVSELWNLRRRVNAILRSLVRLLQDRVEIGTLHVGMYCYKRWGQVARVGPACGCVRRPVVLSNLYVQMVLPVSLTAWLKSPVGSRAIPYTLEP